MQIRYSRISSVPKIGMLCFLLFLFFPIPGKGQSAAPVLEPFQLFAKSNLQEKVFVHTDKNFYLAGETIWFKVYNVEGMAHTSLILSKVAYVEILDKDNSPVLQVKVALTDGSGQGYLILPYSLPSGHFVLRAYTHWMKNTGADYYFQKPFTVINTFQKLGLKPIEFSTDYDVQFFPEGGDLVGNLQSKVAFKVTDINGKGASFIGWVLDQQNDTVARFYTHKFGIGSFQFTPEPNQVYRALLKSDNGHLITRPLPIVKEKGTVMAVSEAGANMLKVTVSSNLAYSATQPMYLLVHTRQIPVLAEARFPDAEGRMVFAVAKDKLGEGISHLTVFNSERKPVCERLYFKKPTSLLTLQVAADKRETGPRAAVKLSVVAQRDNGQPTEVDFSLSVFQIDSLQTVEQPDIVSYLWLSSDLKGTVEAPGYYLSQAGPEADIAIENLMLTHGWRRFSWEKVFQKNSPAPFFLPEYTGHLVQAKVVDSKTGLPAPGVQTYLTIPSRQIRLYGAQSNQDGVVFFETKDFKGIRDVVLQTNTRKDSSYQLETVSPFSPQNATLTLPTFDLPEHFYQNLEAKNVHLQVQNHFSLGNDTLPNLLPIDTTTFYGQPSRTYFLDYYNRFPTLEDVLKEYVSPVMVRKRKGKFYFVMIDEQRKETLPEEPLVLLDGMPVFDLDRLMVYNPKKVRKLEVIYKQYFHGPFTYGGIVSFSTYNGAMEGYEVDPKALLVEYEGLQPTREFYHPVYQSPEQIANRIPDLRNVLYWAGDMRTGKLGKKEIEFYTSDKLGKYVVVVQGLTQDGKAGSSTYTFEVKKAVQ
ncbi:MULTISPECIES: hypothetical protein [Rufibacter]|uniref:Macroglobulin domain-containing protein n=1 Tax=Rufibacter quisquiliarum TaxID=1549639 RepID=A0A839GWP9_9BACT|nr:MULTISPECIES: hypothetical protein [Rufibacter]MBA9078161.1 hypothetical protein [Rufibacter quisquiliarum]